LSLAIAVLLSDDDQEGTCPVVVLVSSELLVSLIGFGTDGFPIRFLTSPAAT